MNGHSRHVATLAVAVALLILSAGSAAAAEHRVPVGNAPFDMPADFCGFPVHVGIVADKEYIVKTIAHPDGSVTNRVTGKLIASFTNTDTGKSIVRNVGGPATTTFAAESATFNSQGHAFGFFNPAEQAAFGVPGLLFITGHSVIVTDADFVSTSITIHGQTEDGCALLR